ncbi:MAG: hypothetical protein CVU29_09455 [Betaproteobacteria bacterium HGW-Betaproteobacteria-22]|nr:MAG: hypothetical protein CVU29_09455 [Betaproteobacteria bacterium HGW-Betaproteobacteria-22]
MNLERQDWKKLQISIIVLVAVVLTVTALIAAAQYFSTQQKQALQLQQNQLNAARQRFQSSGVEKETIIEYLPQYQHLIDNGFVGEERRIEWVEDLRKQHKNHKLFGIKYSIKQQEKYTPEFTANLGNFVLYRSVMQLSLDMLHEGDLLKLTESLSDNHGASFILRDCEITRINPGGAISRQLIANLHADCEIDWLTLREPTPIQEAPQ